jgi:electron transport complex protein RnfD
MNKLLVSPSPHWHAAVSTKSLMLDVVIALLPAVAVSVFFYGWMELLVLAVSVVSCVLLEYLITRYLLKRPSTIGDMSAVVTGILLALNLPPTIPLWIVFIGALVAIGVAKMTFGGIGQNVFNPALTGRVFLLVSFPTFMTHWEIPTGYFGAGLGTDAATGATPLGVIKEGLMQGSTVTDLMSSHGYSYSQMLFANMGGSAGEACAIALLVGFVYLLIRRVIKPYITLSILGTVALVSLLFWLANPAQYTDPLFNLLTGGLILGSTFMATDYVTSPMSVKGGIVFGVGIGFITLMIRYFGSYPEGMSFAILIMNAMVPLLNRWFKQKKYGRA